MISPRSLVTAALATAAVAAPAAAQAQPIDAHGVAPARASHVSAPAASRDDGGIDWTQAGLIAAAIGAFGGAFGFAVRTSRSGASA